MPAVVEYLRRFNRKERFFLIGAALDKPTFALGADFREKLSKELELSVPAEAWVGMDYHIDWIFAAAYFGSPDIDATIVHENVVRSAGTEEWRPVTAHQEDIDLVIAFEGDASTHIIMLEAKAETGWTNKQALSKVSRLRNIFGKDGMRIPGVRPHFLIVSPRKPGKLASETWPAWALRQGKPLWLELPLPQDLIRLTRCDEEGRASSLGSYFRIEPRPTPAPR